MPEEAKRSLSPLANSPMSEDRVASIADTVSEPTVGASVPPTSPGMYFQRPTPLPPARSTSAEKHSPTTVVSSLYATNCSTTSTPSMRQDKSPPSYPALNRTPLAPRAGAQKAGCPSCGSHDSFAGGSCQICGHTDPAMSGRLPSVNAYSYSYSGRAASSYSAYSSSTGYSNSHSSNCPECKASDSMNKGCCEVCGYSRPAPRHPVLSPPPCPDASTAHVETPARVRLCARCEPGIGRCRARCRAEDPHAYARDRSSRSGCRSSKSRISRKLHLPCLSSNSGEGACLCACSGLWIARTLSAHSSPSDSIAAHRLHALTMFYLVYLTASRTHSPEGQTGRRGKLWCPYC